MEKQVENPEVKDAESAEEPNYKEMFLNQQKEIDSLKATIQQMQDSLLNFDEQDEPDAEVSEDSEKVDLDELSHTELVSAITKEVIKQVHKVIPQYISQNELLKAQEQLRKLGKKHPDWPQYQREMFVLSLENPEMDAETLYEKAKLWRKPPAPAGVATERSLFSVVPPSAIEVDEREAVKMAIKELKEKGGK